MTSPLGAAESGTWYTVVTEHGTMLDCTPDGRLRHSHHPADTVRLFRPAGDGRIGLLVLTDQTIPSFARTTSWFAARALPFRIVATSDPVVAGLCTPSQGNLLTAVPDEDGSVVPGATLMQEWERFHLVPVPFAADEALALAASRAGPFLSAARAVPRLLALIEQTGLAGDPELITWGLASLSLRDFAAFAHELIRRPALCSVLSHVFYPDPWFGTGLSPLATWNQQRQASPRQMAIGPALDWLGWTGLDGTYASIGHRLLGTARHSICPAQQICLLATARNEGLYLVEWIAYHRAIGVEALFIYSNNNEDGSDALLKALAEAGVITWIDSTLNAGSPAQPKAYGHALGLLPDLLDYAWVLTIDLDEFFGFDAAQFPSIGAFLDWHETREVDVIQLHWLIFGSNTQDSWEDRSLIERFDHRLPYLDVHVKSLFRPRRFMQSKPHVPVCDGSTAPVARAADGRLIRHELGGGLHSQVMEPQAAAAWINHYYFKSTDELVLKWSRNRGDDPLNVTEEGAGAFQLTPEVAEQFVIQHRDPANVQDTRIQAILPAMQREIERLMGLPGVGQAVAGIHAIYRDRLAARRQEVARLAEADPGSPAARLMEVRLMEAHPAAQWP